MRLIIKKTRRTLLEFVLAALTIGLGIAWAQGGPLYLDDGQPVEKRIDDLLSRMTLEEKVTLVHADSLFTTAGIARLGIPKLGMDDGPLGVREELGENFKVLGRADDFATAMPATLGLAATWNGNLAQAYGAVIGQEAKQRGKNIMLGPSLCIMRTPLCGRNFEYMGEDPWLTARIGVNYVIGEQAQGVASCAKHFAANSQEFERNTINETIDERTLHEIYLPAFRATVQEGGVLAIMGAYNQVNGQFCCENHFLLDDILKTEWGFKGVVISDWNAVHHTELAAINGMDIEMGTQTNYASYFLAAPFLAELRSGTIPVSVLDDKVRRHLYVMFKLNLIHDPLLPVVANAAPQTPLSTPEHQEIARKVAEESFVLLKNNDLLPLNLSRIKTIAVIGGNATAKFSNEGGSAVTKPPYEITALAGISNYPGCQAKIIYAEGYHPFTNSSWRKPPSKAATENSDPKLIAEAVAAAKSADVVVYIGGLNHSVGFDSESADRRDLQLPSGQDELLKQIVGANPKTIVVLYGGGPVEMDQAWLSQVPCLLYAWYPGMEGGNALARVLFGDVNPSGKLPCTFPKKLTDSPAHALNAYPGTNGVVVYKEGLLVGYRWFDTKNIEPLFPFGFGLSYTTFKYSGLNLVKCPDASSAVTVQFELANTGACAGAEVAEVYVQPENHGVFRPLKELKGFKKIFLQPGQKQSVAITLGQSAFSYYDPDTKNWVAEKGSYKILVGGSSRDLPLDGGFNLMETTVLHQKPVIADL
jgi:beta-glucosidase